MLLICSLKRTFLGRVMLDLLLLVLASLLFVLSFPSFLFPEGLGVLAYVALTPLWLLCYRMGLIKALIYGPIYGFFTYMAFNFWLKDFDPEAFVLVPFLYAGYMLLLFPTLWMTVRFYPRQAHLLWPLVWLAYEVLRTKGFVGYAYGQLGSSQYLFPALLGIADVGGQLLISALVVFPSASLAWLLQHRMKVASWLKIATIYLLVFAAVLGYSRLSRVDYSTLPTKRVALLQHNINSWLQSADIYSRAFTRLQRQSLDAFQQGAELIVWSETAFVPAYEFLLAHRPPGRQDDLELALQLQQLLRDTAADFLIGVNENVPAERSYYNTVMLVERGEVVARHRKYRLVPLSESIPFRRSWPALATFIAKLLKADAYDAGKELQVLRGRDGTAYGLLICFEDTFPTLARELVSKGADLLVNVTNDSWAPAQANTNQHFSSALLRSVENRRFMVRAANSGVTAVVDPNGRIIQQLPSNQQGLLIYDLPLYRERTTFFTRVGGPLFEFVTVAGVIVFLLAGFFNCRRNRRPGRPCPA